ncbi:MAG: HDOD domain-containing protein [Candidatus Nitrospinota bacterium M3_3B_026]
MAIFSRTRNASGDETPEKLFRPPIFERLSDRDLELVYSAASERKYSSGDLIIRQGDPRRSFYLIVEGGADVHKDFNGARRKLGALSKGDVVGEIAFISKNPRTATVVANRRSALLEFTPEAFDNFPERVQLRVLRRLAELAEERMESLLGVLHRVERAENMLSAYIREKEETGGNVIRSELVSEVIKNIPKLPLSARELAVKLLDERASPKDVAESVKLDPSLVTMILKTVNSPYFGLSQEVSDFSRAIVLLGFTQVYQLVLYHGIHDLMPRGEDFAALRKRSYMLSVISHEVSLLSSRETAGTNSTIAMLSDVGRSVILLLKRKNPKIAELIDTLDHARLAGALLKSWKLPERVGSVVELQNLPFYLPAAKIPKDALPGLAALHVSGLCHGALLEDEQEPESAYFEDYMSALGFPESRLDVFLKGKLTPALLKNEARLPADVRSRLRSIQYGD